jgi:hypothetical protein
MIHYAIRNIHPEIKVITGDTLDDIICYDAEKNLVELDKSAVTTEIAKLQAAFDALEYSRNRESEYPSIKNVVVALAEKEEGDSTMWDTITAERAAVKGKFPKP